MAIVYSGDTYVVERKTNKSQSFEFPVVTPSTPKEIPIQIWKDLHITGQQV